MKGYGYQNQKDAIDYRNMATDYLNGLESWLMNGVDEMMLLCRDMATPTNTSAFEHLKACCALTLQHALKSMSQGVVDSSEASALLDKETLGQVRVAMWRNRLEPNMIIGLANTGDGASDIAEGA